MSSAKSQYNTGSLEQALREVDEIKGLMGTQIDKVLEREGKLDNLEKRADRLQEQSEQNFGGRMSSRKKKRSARKKGRCAIL